MTFVAIGAFAVLIPAAIAGGIVAWWKRGRLVGRLAGAVAVLAVVLTAATGGIVWLFDARFNPDPPEADYPKPTDALDAQRQDLDYFRKLVAMDRSFPTAARATADRRIDALAARTDALDRSHFRAVLLEIAALADNGHTSVSSKENPNGRSKQFPIRLSSFADGIYVMRAEKANADLLGARVVAIDGKPIDQVLSALMTLYGGTEAWRRSYAALVMNLSEFLHGVDISPSPERSSWTFVTPSGETVQRELAAYQPEYQEAFPEQWRWMSPEPVAGDPHDWQVAMPDAAALPLADAEKTFRRVWIDGTCILYLQMKANQDAGGESISDFLDAAEADMRDRKPCSVILDLRFNGGGDYTNTAGFAGRLPGRVGPDGHIYMLTGTGTFSAGITTAVFVKQAAEPSPITIVGEPVGDRMAFWAEGNRACLPNAPFCFRYSTGMHDYVNGCTEWKDCLWLNRIYPARTSSLEPDETIIPNFADWKAGRDPAFDRALALAKARAE